MDLVRNASARCPAL
ncbi:hypothetical protein ACWDZ6_24755 [Streptomyces sp. NPDC002926]